MFAIILYQFFCGVNRVKIKKQETNNIPQRSCSRCFECDIIIESFYKFFRLIDEGQ